MYDTLETVYGKVEYAFFNKENKRTRPTVLFFHGTPGSACQAEVFCEDLIESGYPVITWSRPGYGATTIVASKFSFLLQAKIAKTIVNMLDVQYVIGYAVSAGGYVLQEFTSSNMNTVQGSILESAVVTGYDYRDRTLYQKLADWLLTVPLGYHIFRRMYNLCPIILNELMLLRYSNMPYGKVRQEALYMYHDPIIRRRLKKLLDPLIKHTLDQSGIDNDFELLLRKRRGYGVQCKEPVLLIHGTADSDVQISETDHVVDVTSNCTLVQIIDGSHVLPLSTRHRYVTQAKLGFLKQF